MKRNLLIAAVLALLGTTAASAQTINVEASVPFSFIVNRATLPAGEYTLKSMDEQGAALAIRDLNSKTANLVLSNTCSSRKSASQTKLLFHRYGNSYFLSQIWTEGSNTGRELPPSAGEKEVARDFSMQQVVLVAAKR
jgi:hypothetical protein